MILSRCMHLVFTLTLFGSVLPASALAATGVSQESIISESRSKVEQALSELGQLREQVARETVPLAQEIESQQRAIATMQSDMERFRRLEDSRRMSLQSLEHDVQSLEETLAAVADLTDRYQRESSALRSQAETQITPAKAKGGLAPLLEVAQGFTLEHRRTSFKGRALAPDGRVLTGKYWRAGDNVWFLTDQGNTALVHNAGHDYPQLVKASWREADNGAKKAGQTAILTVDASGGRAIALSENRAGLWQRLYSGGLWILPILALGGIALVLSLLRAIALWRADRYQQLEPSLALLADGQLDAAESRLAACTTPYCQLARSALAHARLGREPLEEYLADDIAHQRHALQRYLPVIAAAAAVSPLLGLLGTVTGMIKTFDRISMFGSANADSLSGGISEALITTELGLAVAIPLLLIHVLLSRKVKAISARLAELAPKLCDSVNPLRLNGDHSVGTRRTPL